MAIISKEEMQQVGERIKQIRFDNSMDQSTFGNQFNPPASASNVSRWERGINLPSKKRLIKIAELGNVSMDFLLHGSFASDIEIKELVKKYDNGIANQQDLKELNAAVIDFAIFNGKQRKISEHLIPSLLDPTKLSDTMERMVLSVALYAIQGKEIIDGKEDKDDKEHKENKEHTNTTIALEKLFYKIGSYEMNAISKDELFNAIDDLKNAILKDDTNG